MVTLACLPALALALGCSKDPTGNPAPSASDKPAAADPVWRVGAYFSLSGPEAQFGIDSKEGIELALDELNQAGGVKGKPIKVFFEDDKANPQEATNKVLQLIDRDKVVAVLGEVASSISKAGGIVANKKQVPMITPTSTHPDVTKVGPFVFRACVTDDIAGKAGAEFIVRTLGQKKIAILYASNDLYSSGITETFRTEAKRLGAEIVIEKGFVKTETNFTTYLTEIRAASPAVIYAPVYYTAMIPIARQAKAAEIPGSMFVGTDGWDAAELLASAGDELEGAHYTGPYAAEVPWPNSRAFVAKYTARHHHTPSGVAAQAYDAMKLLADAIGRAKDGTPTGIRDAIQATRGFAGATGTITIDADRNADKPMVILEIKAKKSRYFATVNDKSAAAPAPALDEKK
jgi:branched-chain amino acid transport system substrate-binding protein